ncbi:hypothetical protein ASC90_21415 [Rhizobium sp. Root1220]|nr:hypothetical protein ASC90_21415 [Rhizobium sp. Root1220]
MSGSNHQIEIVILNALFNDVRPRWKGNRNEIDLRQVGTCDDLSYGSFAGSVATYRAASKVRVVRRHVISRDYPAK